MAESQSPLTRYCVTQLLRPVRTTSYSLSLHSSIAMAESDSDDDLLPHQLGRREIGHHFFSDSDDDDEVRDYDSCDDFSLPSIGDDPPNDVDNTSDDDSATPDGHFCGENVPNQDTDLGMEVEPALPLRERQEMGGVMARKGRNEEADHLFINGEICFLSFDIIRLPSARIGTTFAYSAGHWIVYFMLAM